MLYLSWLLHTSVLSTLLEHGVLQDPRGVVLENWKIVLYRKVGKRAVEHVGYRTRCAVGGCLLVHFGREVRIHQELTGTSCMG